MRKMFIFILLLPLALLFLNQNSYSETIEAMNFEHGQYIWNTETSNGTITVTSTKSHSGSYSLKSSVTADGGHAKNNIIYLDVAPFSSTYLRFWIYVPTATINQLDVDSDEYKLVQGMDTNWASLWNMRIVRWGGIKYFSIDWNNWTGDDKIAVFSGDTWHCIELYFLSSATVGVVKVWVDGTLEMNHTSQDTNANPLRCVQIGITWANGVTSGDVYYDDIVLDSSRYIGTGWRVMQDRAVGSQYQY